MNDAAPSLALCGAADTLKATAGELTLLRGDIGSGKSLWLERMAGLRPLPEGVSLRTRPRPPRIRMLSDRWPRIWLGQSPREELLFGLPGNIGEDMLGEILARWKIGHLDPDADISALNRLEGLRLSLAAIELASPDLVLLDSPTDGLPAAEALHIAGETGAWARRSQSVMVVACNRWQDWHSTASQVWLSLAPSQMPTLETGEH